ncbi:LysR family transcriptional regulator [Variovorax sp. VNK109]|uniref:LysR family transcriptional regulator n=1 Tax=Variovorax sp. VNK109 TaxID=3400919 RepID=UPI003BFF7107
MDLKQLRAFLTVSEVGSVTRAAELLNLVQPTVSRQLQLLEEDMGTPLFERGARRMTLTAAGKTMVEYTRRILNEVARAKAEIRPEGGSVAGIVSIGLLASTSDLLSTPIVSAISNAYPQIRPRIVVGYAGHLVELLENGEVDFALLYDQKNTPALHVTTLIEEELWVVGPVSANLRRSRPVQPNQLALQRFVLPSAPYGLRALIEQAVSLMQVQLDVVAETDSLSVQKNLVMNGHGWTILPAASVSEDVAQKRLSATTFAGLPLRRKIVIAAPASRQPTTSVRCALTILLDQMKTMVQSKQWTSAVWLAEDWNQKHTHT